MRYTTLSFAVLALILFLPRFIPGMNEPALETAPKTTTPASSFAGSVAQIANAGILTPGNYPAGQVLDGTFFPDVAMPANGIVSFYDQAAGEFQATQNVPLLQISGTVVLKHVPQNHEAVIELYRKSDHTLVWQHGLYQTPGKTGVLNFTVPFFALGNATDFYFVFRIAQDSSFANPTLVMLRFDP